MEHPGEKPKDTKPDPTIDPEELESGGTRAGRSAPKMNLGPYEIIEEIGRGGMGVVYKAFHPSLKRTVALKVLIAGEDASEEAIARFRREAEAVAKLGHHTNIVPVHDIGVEGKTHYFAMHYVEGRSLDRIIDEGEIAPRDAAQIAMKVALALAHAHAHGILHRDVKPANILLAEPDRPDRATRETDQPDSKGVGGERGRVGEGGTGREGEIPNPKSQIQTKSQISNPNEKPEQVPRTPPHLKAHQSGESVCDGAGGDVGSGGSGIPMLTDFGLAKDIESRSKVTRSGMTLGTPNYMPPEQADGRIRDIDSRSDVYSLGAALYEMLTYQPPFEGDTVISIIQKVILTDPIPPRKRNKLVDKDLETICLKCLEKDPGRRYQSAMALERDLANFLEGNPISARPAGFLYRISKKAGRHKALAATAAVSAILLTAAAVIAAILLSLKEGEKDREVNAAMAHAGREKDRADEAQGRADDEERLRIKNEAVAGVMLNAAIRLRDIHAELKASFYDDTKTIKQKKEFYGRKKAEIDKFFAPLVGHGGNTEGPDPAPDAFPETRLSTALALKAWFLGFSGDEEEALAMFEQARRMDPGVGWGWLFQAMYWLSRYLAGHHMPGFTMGAGGIKFSALPWEKTEMKTARRNFEKLASDLAALDFSSSGDGRPAQGEAPVDRLVWGVKLSPGFLTAVLSPAIFAREEVARMERSVSALLDLPEFFWMEEELLRARSSFRYVLQDFEAGLEDALEFRKRCPENAAIHLTVGDLKFARASVAPIGSAEKAGFLREAIDSTIKAIERNLDAAIVYNKLGIEYHELGDAELSRGMDPAESYRKALEAYGESSKRDRNYASAYANRGSVYKSLGEIEARQGKDPRPIYGKAIAEFDEGLRLDPDYDAIQFNRGGAYLELAKYEASKGLDPAESFQRAIRDFRSLAERSPGDAGIHTRLGETYNSFALALSRRGEDPRPWYRKSITEHATALRMGLRDLVTYNGSGMAHCHLGFVEAQQGNDPRDCFRRAIEDFSKGIELNPDIQVFYFNRGNAYRGLGEAEERRGLDPRPSYRRAIEEYGKTVEKDPAYIGAIINRGITYDYLGKACVPYGLDPQESFRRTIEDYEKAIELDPSNWRAHANLGSACSKAARYVEAVKAFERAISLAGDTVPALVKDLADARARRSYPAWARENILASTMMKAGGFAPACKAYERVFELAEEAGVLKDGPGGSGDASVLSRSAFNLACAWAQLSVGRKGRLAEPEPVSEEAAASCRKTSLDHLRISFELGLKEPDRARSEPLLEPVSGRPEFEDLLAEFNDK